MDAFNIQAIGMRYCIRSTLSIYEDVIWFSGEPMDAMSQVFQMHLKEQNKESY